MSKNEGNHPSQHGLTDQGLHSWGTAYWNLDTPHLVEAALKRGEGALAANGALVVRTGQYTGRSVKDKFIVRDGLTENTVDWGTVNQPMDAAKFDGLYAKAMKHLEGKDLFVQDLQAGADPAHTINVRAITEFAWHSLFGRTMLLRPATSHLDTAKPNWTILFVPSFTADPAADGTASPTVIAVNFSRRIVLIGGTEYAGELKKSVFTILNYELPDKKVFPMHCSANQGPEGDVAVFFGLSGTGKTTLSADPTRGLIGDDEHGWSDNGVFNFEGGCYAKCIKLSQENEPQIWNAVRFGSVLENVVMDPATRLLDYNADTYTENTRAAYRIDFIDNAIIPSVGGQPKNIVFLTADAFGVLPPVSKLSPEQAMYHFLSGYTAKLAGTERGLGKEPQATFSTCFGAPFLPRPAQVYAELLGTMMRKYNVPCWLVNTGWVGGPASGEGKRMKLPYTRAMVNAALAGKLASAQFETHPVFGVSVPKECPDVPPSVLDARGQWADKAAYDAQAQHLAGLFQKNFTKFKGMPDEIVNAGPKVMTEA
jgi:phosphoenolpyruvate carboxykinase (ATP)